MTIANSRLRTIAEYAVAVVLCLVIVTCVMKLWRANPRTPFEYGGDALFHGMVIKGIIDNGWYLRNNFIGMPGGAELFYFPMADNLHFLLIKLFSLFSSDYALIFNFYFLLTFPLTTISALYVFRHFNISYLIAVLGSLLYTFLPYHFFRNQHHLVLAGYYIVPLMVMVLLWVFSGRLLTTGVEDNNAAPRKINLRSKGFIASIVICLLIASGGLGYYAFFACFFLTVAGVAAALYWKSVRHLMVSLILIAVVFSGFVINLVPNMIYIRSNGENRTVKRGTGEAEDYGLKITQLLLPIEGHRIGALASLKAKYNSNAPLVNENTNAALGVIGSIGFLALLAWLFYRMSARTKEAAGAGALLNQLSILNICGVLLATMGGFASLFALLISPQIRSYNRVSIYLAFFSLFAVMLLLESFARRRIHSGKPRLIFQLSLGLLLVLGILDQTGKGVYFVPDYSAFGAENASDADFVSRIETALPDGGMIFQLPYVPFPEDSVPGIEVYEPFRPYLHSKKLRWSYGAIKERENDRWQKLITNLPTEQFLETISLAGFSGVYIDRRGYSDNGAEIEARLANLLDTKPLLSADGQMIFFNMGGYNRKLPEKYGAAIESKRNIALHPLTLEWTGGCSGLEGSAEHNWHWCSSEGELEINNPSGQERKLKLEMAFGSGYQDFANLSLDGPLISERLKINNKPTAYSKEISVPPGRHTIRFTCDAKPIHAPLDKRSLIFQVQNFSLQELK